MRSASFALFAISLVATVSGAAVKPRSSSTSSKAAAAAASSSGFSTATSSAPGSDTTAGAASKDPNESYYDAFKNSTAEPIRGQAGAAILGPTNEALAKESADFINSPSTDAGSVSNAKWSFQVSHNRVQIGGWARQQNVHDMPLASEMAGVNMRLRAGGIRELHWHSAAEWAYMLAGSARISAVNSNGQAYTADLYPGDLWYFPSGIPHTIQGLQDIADGCEFLLVFDDGSFSEDETFQLADWAAHVPKEVLAKNLGLNISVLDHIPARQLWIFPGTTPPASPAADQARVKSIGEVPEPYSFAFSKVKATTLAGGSVKIADSTTFNVSKTIAAAEVTVQVGGIREFHWHPTEPEWTYFLEGTARITIFAGSGNARTFDYQAGDVGYVEASWGHYVENIGDTPLKFLEIFKAPKYEDISLTQWLALSPPQVVKDHLNLPDDVIANFSREKQVVL